MIKSGVRSQESGRRRRKKEEEGRKSKIKLFLCSFVPLRVPLSEELR